MKKILFALAVLFSSLHTAQAQQVTVGGEYAYTAWCNMVWTDTLTATPKLASFPLGIAFSYDMQNGGQITHNPSGPQLTPPVPAQIVVDLLRADLVTQTVTFTDPVTNQSITISMGGIVTAFQAVGAKYRAGPPAPPASP